MSTQAVPTNDRGLSDWAALARELGPRFAARAPSHDVADSFVADNYRDLRERRVFSAGVPAELGGGGASHAELCTLVRVLGQHCGSTALALAMHTHQVAIAAWRWRHDGAPTELLLRRVADQEAILVTSGGSDWLAGSGRAEKVAGGYRITGRKVFASGAPAGDLFMTMALLDDPEGGPTVVHVAIPFDAPGLEIQDTWHTTGLRGTGSNDYRVTDLFVPERHTFSFLERAPPRGSHLAAQQRHSAQGFRRPARRRALDHRYVPRSHPRQDRVSEQPPVQESRADSERDRRSRDAPRCGAFVLLHFDRAALVKNEEPTEQERADLWLSNINVCQSSRQIIRLLFDSVGGSAIYTKKSAFDRALRDSETWCQHIIGQRRTLEMVGSLFLKSDDTRPSPLL